MPPPRRPAPGVVLACLVVLLLARAALPLSLADCFFTGEELAHGAISKALLDGLELRLCDVNYVYYEGGGLLSGVVGALFFSVVGPSLLALKLTAFVFDACNLIAGMFLAAHFGARRAPLFFGMAYVLSPIACQQMALIDVGNHHLAISFFFLVLLFALRVRERAASERVRGFDQAALGLAAGVGTWADLMVGLLVAFVFVFLLVGRHGLREWRAWGVISVSFVIGMTPFWYTLAAVGANVLDVHGIDLRAPFGETSTLGGKANLFARAWEALGPRGRAQCVLLLGLPLLVLLGRQRRDGSPWSAEATRAWRTCALFTALLLVVTRFSRFCPVDFYHHQDVMRLLPHAALLALLGAGVLARWVESPAAPLRAIGWAAMSVQLALGAHGTLELVRQGTAGDVAEAWDVLTTTKGYDYGEYVPKLVAKFEAQDPLRRRAALGFVEPDPGLLYPTLAGALYPHLDESELPRVERELRELDPQRWRAFLPGLGPALVYGRGGDFCGALGRLEAADHLSPESLDALREAVGRVGSGRHPRPVALASDLEIALACDSPAAFYRGFGYRLYFGYRLDRRGAEELLSRWPPHVQAPLREGYEACRRLNTVGH